MARRPGFYCLLFFVTFFPASILAGLGGARGLDGAPRAGRVFSPGLAGAVVDRVRTGRDQAAALRAAALSRHRHPHRRRGRDQSAVAAALAGARHDVVVHRSDHFQHRRRSSPRSSSTAILRSRRGRSSPPRSCAACSLGDCTRMTAPNAPSCGPRPRMVLLAIGVFAVVLPSLTPAFPSVALAEVLRDAACPLPVAASAGYEEPSLVFLAGTATRLTDAAGAADFLCAGGCRFAFIESRQERAFALRAEAIGLRYSRGPRIEGYNISNGQPITHCGLPIGGRAVNGGEGCSSGRVGRSVRALPQNVLGNFRAMEPALSCAPPRAKPRRRRPRRSSPLSLTLVAVGRFDVSHRAAASDWARHLPHWFTSVRANHQCRPWRLVPDSVRLHCAVSRGPGVAGFAAPDAGRARGARRAVRLSVHGGRRARACSSPSSSA